MSLASKGFEFSRVNMEGMCAKPLIVSRGNYVDTLVTVDPVGRTHTNVYKIQANSGIWINYDSTSTQETTADKVAWWGRRYDDHPKGFADLHIKSELEHVDICKKYCIPVR